MLSVESIRSTLLYLPSFGRSQLEVLMHSPTDTNAYFMRGYLQCLLDSKIINADAHQQANLLVSTIVFNARIGAVMNEEGM